MNLDEILSAEGKYKSRRRIGRGNGSGHGKTSGRGHKGSGARAGKTQRLGLEGGTNPALARIPKRGFNNYLFRKEYTVVNLARLDELFEDGSRVDGESLVAAGIVDDVTTPVKVLGTGQLTKKLTIVAAKFSASAAEKIAQAGGTAEVA